MEETECNIINIYLTVDRQTINNYFNGNDPAPIYKRQLSHQLEEYIKASVASAKRYTTVIYKFKCISELDQQYAQPLIYAVRRHYAQRKEMRIKEFKRFKHRSWWLLLVSLVMVLICQGIIPLFINEEHGFSTMFLNSLDIFSWVLLWRPIDLLLFYWNPHLKDISLLNKLASAELIVIENEK
jgi:hypothetical protein